MTVSGHKKRYRLPAEWEPQSAIWLSWPHNNETWPKNLEAAQAEFVSLVRAVAESQLAKVLVPKCHTAAVAVHLKGINNVELVEMETNDAWARDYAPTFAKDQTSGALVAIDWYYNAWGGKYPPFEADQNVAKQLADLLGVPHVAGGLCFEGGAIDINEDGVLLTTESCALNPNRNAGFSKAKSSPFCSKGLVASGLSGCQATWRIAKCCLVTTPMGISINWLGSLTTRRLFTPGLMKAIHVTRHLRPTLR